MYEAYYGLREKPFNLTPDPKYLFLSEKHKEAFAHLLFGIKNRSGFVMVTGEIGTGKTTICRTLLGQLDENTEVAFIFNPCLSPEELLRKINEDFGITTHATTVKGLIDELNVYLLDRNTKGKNCVLVIDEAQNLTPNVLEQIRLLSNLETETQKLLQIVLIGQPELMQMLSLHELRQLNQRITARYHLHELSRDETHQYIAYRMRVAGARRRIYFTASAIKQVFKFSKGTPRVINALCDRSLLIGYTREVRDITPVVVRQAAKEIRGEQPKKKVWPQIRAWFPSPAVITAFAAIILLVVFVLERPNLTTVQAPAPPANQVAANATAPQPNASQNVAFAAPVPVEKAVEAVRPPGPGEIDTSFAGLIDRQDPVASRNAAVQSVLRMWNLALITNLPPDDSVVSLTKFAADNRLSSEVMTLTLEQIEAINLPALIKLHGRGRSIWGAIVGAEGDELRITTGPTEATLVPRDRVTDCYLNEAIVLWRDPAPDLGILRSGMSGEDVRVLQVQLGAVGRLERQPTGQYDQATADAVRSIQKETGLTADGATGKRTRMVLSSWLPGFNTPGLRAMPPVLMRDAKTDDGSSAPAQSNPALPSKTAAKTTVGEKKPRASAKPADEKPKANAEVPAPPAETPQPAAPTPPPAAEPAPPADVIPAAPADMVPPAVQSEELGKPSEQATLQVLPVAAAADAAQMQSDSPTDADAPAWTGGLPLVPADESGAAR